MFNKKLKQRIDELQKEIKNQSNEIWKLQNPPQYKVGDKVGKNEVVINVSFEESWGYHGVVRYWLYKVVQVKTKKVRSF